MPSQIPAPTNRVENLWFRAAETSNYNQWDKSRPEPGSNKRNSEERHVYGSCMEAIQRKMKVDNAVAYLQFIRLVYSARRSELDSISASSTSMAFATSITFPYL